MKGRAIKLAFCSRSISSWRQALNASSHQSASSKGGSFAIRPQHTETMRFISSYYAVAPNHRGAMQGQISGGNLAERMLFIFPYSTASDNHRGARQGQISGANLTEGSPKLYLLGFGAIVATIGGYFWYHSNERKGPIQARKSQASRTVLTDQKTSIGGPFKLIDSKGQLVISQGLMRHWTLIYFGYTSCPDDCPEELQKLVEAVEIIEKQTGQRMVPVFITLDPKRDSPAQLQTYLSEFHPRFLGLTGTTDDIRQVAREYRVFYRKIEEEGSDYLVEHSNLIYLMDPKMEFVKFFGKEYDAKSLARGIIEEMKKGESQSSQSTG